METPQHHSLVEADSASYDFRDRNSDIRVEPSETNATPPRYSDYEYSPDWDVERGSTGVIYDQTDVRVSASSDRLLRRGRVNVRSNNRLSSIYGGNLTSWASDRLQTDLSRFSIPEDFEDPGDGQPHTELQQSINATQLKLRESESEEGGASTSNLQERLTIPTAQLEHAVSAEPAKEPRSRQIG